jgi:hypothetical protein
METKGKLESDGMQNGVQFDSLKDLGCKMLAFATLAKLNGKTVVIVRFENEFCWVRFATSGFMDIFKIPTNLLMEY